MPPRIALRLILATAALLTAACADTDPTSTTHTDEPSRIEGNMTPEQAADAIQQHLRETVAAIRQVNISEVDLNLEKAGNLTPCGGLAGNEHSSLDSDIYGVVGVDEWDGDAEAARGRVTSALSPEGYRALQPIDAGDGRTQVNWSGPDLVDNTTNFSVTVFFETNGGINVSGGTPCLPDPEAKPGL